MLFPLATAAPRPVSAPLAQLPNALTLARFVLVPIFVVMLVRADAHSWPAAVVFAIAGVTDQIDGWLARLWRVQSEFGKYADPLADRLMIDAAVIILSVDGRLPWVALAVIIARDTLLLAGTRYVLPRGYDFSVNLLGKTATWVLYVGVGFLVADTWNPNWPLWLFWIGVGLAVGAAVLYMGSAWRAIRR
jgi:CDP-diacylglycerol--glycerol-3-phosphate 3-phosphatidyltransferase